MRKFYKMFKKIINFIIFLEKEKEKLQIKAGRLLI